MTRDGTPLLCAPADNGGGPPEKNWAT